MGRVTTSRISLGERDFLSARRADNITASFLPITSRTAVVAISRVNAVDTLAGPADVLFGEWPITHYGVRIISTACLALVAAGGFATRAADIKAARLAPLASLIATTCYAPCCL